MVRRALAIDRSNKIRLTPVTELVQIRVYRRIPKNPHANMEEGDFGEQDVCEFVLDRAKLFAGQHGLRAMTPDDPAEPFTRSEGDPFTTPVRQPADPADDPRASHGALLPSLKTCIQCHQHPGVRSVLSMRAALAADPTNRSELFRTYAFDVETKMTISAKTRQYNWGLLQGLVESD
jgi:hypothetical protein